MRAKELLASLAHCPAHGRDGADDQQSAQGSFGRARGSASFCFPPVERCNGVSPSRAAKSCPLSRARTVGARATSAVILVGPIPGIVIAASLVGAPGDSRSSSASLSYSDRNCSMSSLRIGQASPGMSVSKSPIAEKGLARWRRSAFIVGCADARIVGRWAASQMLSHRRHHCRSTKGFS